MSYFLTDDFLLEKPLARTLYHEIAAPLPIADFHNHLSAREIAEKHRHTNLSQAWLTFDHYKWRAMRQNGVAEKFCTGDATDFEKFAKYAETLSQAAGHPLYVWSHLELKRYFGIDQLLSPQTARTIYDKASELLQDDDHTVPNLLAKMRVRVLCTTDDPVDDLHWHDLIKTQNLSATVLPTFRPDQAYNISNPQAYPHYIERLGVAAGITITSLDALVQALEKRLMFFTSHGCRLSDHSLERFSFDESLTVQAPAAFAKALSGKPLDAQERTALQSFLLPALGRLYHAHNIGLQLHTGALRNTCTRLRESAGPDTGSDTIDSGANIRSLAALLDSLDKSDSLPRTIMYNLNPCDNQALAALCGSFCDGSSPAKVQWGPAWWFADQRFGMEHHLSILASHGLLGRFIGMTTDSRSFLSFPRHEYFRRILCRFLAHIVEAGEFPPDIEILGTIIRNVCYGNAMEWLGLKH